MHQETMKLNAAIETALNEAPPDEVLWLMFTTLAAMISDIAQARGDDMTRDIELVGGKIGRMTVYPRIHP